MTTDPRPANVAAAPNGYAPAGSDPLSGHSPRGLQGVRAAEGTSSPQAKHLPASSYRAPAGSTITRPATLMADTNTLPPAGLSDSLSGHNPVEPHIPGAAEGHASPQASSPPASNDPPPAGSKTSHGQIPGDTHKATAVAADPSSPLAYKLLGFAAVMLDDQEKVRIQAEHRLRQMTRDEDDMDGQRRGLGLTLNGPAGPAVAGLAGLVLQMKCDSAVALALGIEKERKAKGCCLEHEAERKLIAQLRETPLAGFPEVAGVGVGDRQVARLLGATGDPYLRAPGFDTDGILVPGTGQPRTLSQWRAYCGHGDPERRPFKGMSQDDAFRLGNRTAKMRAHLIAEQCIKYTGAPDKNGNAKPRSTYRDAYDAARAEYAGRVHARECRNASRISPNGCGTRDHPEWGEIGSPWRDGHQHAAALRLVAKTFLDDLYAEAKRIHEQAAG